MNDLLSNESSRSLIKAFGDPEVRQAYAEGFQHTWIASQLTRIRQQRGLTQKDLADLVGTKQPGIARMERDDYGKWNIATLNRIAAALDCWLMVSFESYGALLERVAAFTSPAFLDRPLYQSDPLLNPVVKSWPALAQPGPSGEMSRKLEKWFDTRSPIEGLKDWLNGVGLPPVGEDIPPSQWLADALSQCPTEYASVAAVRVAKLVEESAASGALFSEPGTFGVELFRLSAAWPKPEVFCEPLGFAWERSANAVPDSLRHPLRRNQVEAMKLNQTSDRFENLWTTFIRQGWRAKNDHDLKLIAGFAGLVMIPNAPNSFKFVEGCKLRPIPKNRAEARSGTVRLTGILTEATRTLAQSQLAHFRQDVWDEARHGNLAEDLLNALSAVAPAQPSGSEGYIVQRFLAKRFGDPAAFVPTVLT